MSQPAIETVEVTKTFNDITAVQHVTLTIPTGSIQAIVGANGAGKSTLLRLIIGLFAPTAGTVRILGDTLPQDPSQLHQRVHYVSSDVGMYETFRVCDIFRYASLLYHHWDADKAKRLCRALALPQDRAIRSLSLGVKMQVKLAIAFAACPEVLVLDEPANGLDPMVKHQLFQLIVEHGATSAATVVIATHQLADVERIADRVAFMYQGKLVANYALDDVKEKMKTIYAIMRPDGPAEFYADWPGVLYVKQTGSHAMFIVDGTSEDVKGLLARAGASQIEEHPVELSELFRCLMEKEGYQRDRVILA